MGAHVEWKRHNGTTSPSTAREATARSETVQNTYTAPAPLAELSAWLPSMPVALLDSFRAPTARVLPSPDSATLSPKRSWPVLDALT